MKKKTRRRRKLTKRSSRLKRKPDSKSSRNLVILVKVMSGPRMSIQKVTKFGEKKARTMSGIMKKIEKRI